MPDYGTMLRLTNLLRAPAIHAAIDSLTLPPGSRGADIGCGIGLHTGYLAERVAPAGTVTGVDYSSAFIEACRREMQAANLTDVTEFAEEDVHCLPFPDHTFDWVRSADTVWPGPATLGCPNQRPEPMIAELVRIVKPVGRIGIAFWSSQRLLPGYPQLEARLSATTPATAPLSPAAPPEHHFLSALGWLQEAGLQECRAQTFAATVHAPLGKEDREALLATMAMFWEGARDELTESDWRNYERLCRVDSSDCIVDRPGYCAIITYTLFSGRVPE
jgi:demethylmenaquinone methyltransferase/2-methoxy-6-polyprenyl-1,4-benzoquinol methylase